MRSNIGASAGIALFAALALPQTVLAQPTGTSDSRPYDERLLRLSEILGAVHYLRELCGANEGQLWRDRMKELVDAEATSALRRARLTRAFNAGYRNYSRTYNTCTPSAQTAVGRFMTEATTIADAMVRTVP